MIRYFKKILKWNSIRTLEDKKNHSSYILSAFVGILEDLLFWKTKWLTLAFIFFLNILFFVFLYRQAKLLQVLYILCIAILCIDAFEVWLKYKHRTAFLKRIAAHDGAMLNSAIVKLNNWIERRWREFIYLREVNHTKASILDTINYFLLNQWSCNILIFTSSFQAFILVNLTLGMIFLIGKYINGYVLTYIICMILCVFHKLAPPIRRLKEKIQQNAESDGELEELIPKITDVDIKLLSIEPEQPIIDEKLSLDYWKPEDLPPEEISDSSENSSSIVTNISMDKMQTLQGDVETSDSSEDEYIPLVQQNDQLQSTLEVVQSANTWSHSAYSAFRNLTGAVANMMYTISEDDRRNRVSSIDSSDGFEFIDKNDIM